MSWFSPVFLESILPKIIPSVLPNSTHPTTLHLQSQSQSHSLIFLAAFHHSSLLARAKQKSTSRSRHKRPYPPPQCVVIGSGVLGGCAVVAMVCIGSAEGPLQKTGRFDEREGTPCFWKPVASAALSMSASARKQGRLVLHLRS